MFGGGLMGRKEASGFPMNLGRDLVTKNRIDHVLDEIAQLLAEDTDYPLDGTLLYAEVGDGFVSPSIFKDRNDHILYRSPDLDRLGDALLDLWKTQDSDRRWAEIEYVVRGDRFRASFIYPDEIDPEEQPRDRRRRIVEKHFGKKKIVYPPKPDNTFEFAADS